MKNFMLLTLILFLQLSFGQSIDNDLLSDYSNYNIVLNYYNDFNNDGIKDKLYVLSSEKENNENLINNNDSISKRKLVIYFGSKNNYFKKVYENDNIFPCRECLGKSDNYVRDLKFENSILNYTTTIAPFSSEEYSVIDFTLQYVNNDFIIFQYKETYFSVETDDNVSIKLDSKDVSKIKFNYYDWIADKTWIDYVNISNQNLTMLNNFAYRIENINPYVSIKILQKILVKFPNRVVAYLNLANSYWNIGEKEKAVENYKKYTSLMKLQKKDLKKILKYVLERIK